MITDFHGCETEGSSFYRARICCVFGCIGKGIGRRYTERFPFVLFSIAREKKGRLVVLNIGMDDFEDSIEREF